MSKQKTDPPTTSPVQSWQLHLGRQGLHVHAGRHLTLTLSLPLLTWTASISGLVGTAGHWTHLLP
ncbi:hypothetical protein [Streptomyces sp. NPDC005017]|uniref:hypothetical protein n=1 Tax=Streptomyces sp. NPDC005017 TaxID=3364706 RepID=UPI0036B31C63